MPQPINLEIFQCDMAFYKSLRTMNSDFKKTPLRAFCLQREQAKNRGVVWNLTLPEWWGAWQRSGHWEQRGRGTGKYVMARYLDRGPYEIGNIYICLFQENLQHIYVGISADGKRKSLRAPTGWPAIATKRAAEKRIAAALARKGLVGNQ